MCIQGLHSRKLVWCATDVTDYWRSLLTYRFIDVNPAVALSGPRGVMHSNNQHISHGLFFALTDNVPCKYII